MIIDPNTNAAAYGGYTVTNLREAGGEETLRFDAFLCLHGTKILYVYNAGTGGSHVYQPVNEDWAGFRGVEAAFEAYAAEWNEGTEFGGIEDGDQLINRLVEVATLNRMRKVPFVLDDEDFWRSGECHQFQQAVSREQVAAVLSGPAYSHRNPRVWDKCTGDFVPVAQIVTDPIYEEGQ